MIRNISRRYFEVWGSEEAQNVFLKYLLMIFAALFGIQAIALTVLSLRKPVLIAMGDKGTEVLAVHPPSAALVDIELKRIVQSYIEAHYNWEPSTIEKAHSAAARYVSEKFIKAFLAANAEQVRTVKEKKVSERVYLSGEIQVNREKLSAVVPMDRVFSVNGIRATSPLTLEVQFEVKSLWST